MILCPSCQTENRPQARFCMTCGEVLTNVTPPAPGPDTPSGPGQEATASQEDASIAATIQDSEVSPVPSAEDDLLPTPPEPTPDAGLGFTEASQPDADAAQKPLVKAAKPDSGETLSGPQETSLPETSELVASLEIGALIGERFEVIGLVEDQGGQVYTAVDHGSCAQCGALVKPADTFCQVCGLELAEPPAVRLQELAAAPETSDEHVVAAAGTWYQVLPASEDVAQEVEQAMPGWRLEVGQASHPGQARALDEDSVLAMTLSTIHESCTCLTLGLYAVADGIGGQDAGEVASRLAIQTLAQQVLQRVIWPELQGEPLLLETLAEQLSAAVQAAGQAVHDARLVKDSDMGTTLTTALIRNEMAVIANVGDSRTYVWGPDGLLQLTEDHSLVAQLIAAGEVPPEAIYTHPQRSLISRCLGDGPDVRVDLFTLVLEPGYRLLLCCDGVWEMIRDEGIEEVLLRENHPQRAADTIVTWSNEAGGEDNISVIIVNVERA